MKKKKVKDKIKAVGRVTTTLTNVLTGETRVKKSHNIPLNYQFSALSRWMAGENNEGYNAIPPPSQIEYGSGSGTPAVTDTGPFTPISGSLTNLSYVQANTPASGTTTFTFQTPAGVITTQVTEAFLRDTSGNGFAHTMYGAPFTPSSSENVTTQWQITYGT